MSCATNNVTLEINTGIDFALTLNVTVRSSGDPIDVSDWTDFDGVLKTQSGTTFLTATVAILDGPAGTISYLIPAADTAGLPNSRGVHGLKATRGDGVVVLLMQGEYEVKHTVF